MGLKSIKEWFDELPDPERTQAIENMFREMSTFQCKNMCEALNNGFTWDDTPEGFKYWERLASEYEQ